MALEILIAIAIVLAVVYVVKTDKKTQKKEDLDFAVAIVEEGIAYAEENMRIQKREAAHNTGIALRKQPPEDSKDPIKAERFFNSSMKPVRDMTHDMARKYILDTVEKIKSDNLRKMINSNTIDSAIKLRIVAAKIQIVDPLRPYFYKFL